MTVEEYFEKGNEEYKKGNYKEAIANYDKAIELNDAYAMVYNNRGIVYNEQKQYDKAIRNYCKAIELNPKFVDAFINKGIAHKSIKKYNLAIKDFNQAIELNPTNARIYYNRALTYSDLKEYDKSISDYTLAIKYERLDFIFQNRGATFYLINKYSHALDDYNKGLSLNPKNANIWEAKGSLYITESKYQNTENARICFIRALFLGVERYHNFFVVLNNDFTQPFLTFRLIREKAHPSQYHQVTSLLHKSFDQCNALYSFIAHQNLKREVSYTETTWKKWLGIINYYMGDPITSFELLKSLVEAGSQDLMVYYYLILSCYDFAEDEEPYIEKAIEIAESIRTQKTKRQEDIIQCYYAGMLFWLNTEEEDALIYFSKIQKNFLPAAYQMLWLYHKDNRIADYNKIKQSIIQRESKDNKYAKGAEVHYLDLENDTLSKPFAFYFHYFEIEDAINVFGELADNEVDFEIQHSMFQEPFYELFKIRPEDLEVTRLRADIAPYLEEWEAILKQTKPTEINAPTLDNFDFKNVFQALQKSALNEEIEENLGLHIQNFSLNVKQYEELLTYFYLNDHFSEYQKLMLHFYIHYRSRQGVDSKHLSGLDKVVQEIVGGSLALLTGIITGGLFSSFVSASAVTAIGGLATAYSKGTLGKLFTEWYVGNQDFKTYQDFKANFESFISAERERLGENKFDNLYPIRELKSNKSY